MINVISQSFGLDVVNINAYAKFYTIRVMDIFHEQSGDKIFTNYPVTKSNVDYRALYEIQPSVSVDFLGSCNENL